MHWLITTSFWKPMSTRSTHPKAGDEHFEPLLHTVKANIELLRGQPITKTLMDQHDRFAAAPIAFEMVPARLGIGLADRDQADCFFASSRRWATFIGQEHKFRHLLRPLLFRLLDERVERQWLGLRMNNVDHQQHSFAAAKCSFDDQVSAVRFPASRLELPLFLRQLDRVRLAVDPGPRWRFRWRSQHSVGHCAGHDSTNNGDPN